MRGQGLLVYFLPFRRRYELWLLTLLNIHIRYYTCDMVDSVFTEHHDLLAIFHFAIIVLIHTIYKRVIDKI